MQRREFIAVLAAATAWPITARAQQSAMPVIGMLEAGPPNSWDFAGFRRGLSDVGYVEGRNLTVEYRWAGGSENRLRDMAVELVQRQVEVIATLGSGPAVTAAIGATRSIPIVFGYGGDPVKNGHVTSFNRPGGNITGMTSLSGEIAGKQLGMLRELLPRATRFGILDNPGSVTLGERVSDATTAASVTGLTVEVLPVTTAAEIDQAFASLEQKPMDGLIVGPNPILFALRSQIVQATARRAIPAIYPFSEYARAGGLMSYGPSLSERDRGAGQYVGRILRGEKPGDLPVVQTARFELVLNMKAAKALHLAIPNAMQMLADEIVE
jgi:putative ABC transport system substrate-binding protein